MNLYQTEILDHYRHPRNRGRLANATISSGLQNPSCGDSVLFDGIVANDRLIAVGFESVGCVISQAAASLISESIKNLSLSEIKQLDASFVLQLLGIELGPIRLKCALLPLEAVHTALQDKKESEHA